MIEINEFDEIVTFFNTMISEKASQVEQEKLRVNLATFTLLMLYHRLLVFDYKWNERRKRGMQQKIDFNSLSISDKWN